MLTTQELLDLAKLHSKLPSDYKLGVVLGLSNSAMSNYRHGRSKPDDQVGAQLAQLSGLDAGYVLACLHAERSKDQAARSVWESVAARLASAGAAAGVCLAVVASPDAAAFSGAPMRTTVAPVGLLSNWLRRLASSGRKTGKRSIPPRGDSALALC